MLERKSACRICAAGCGTIVTVDADGRLTGVRPDRDHPLSKGYACIKGLQAVEAAAEEGTRLLGPKKRVVDGVYADIHIETALDEIGEKLRRILDEDGPGAIAGYRGVMTAFNTTADQMLGDWFMAIGSPSFFTNYTIDQSAKGVTACRMGAWEAGCYSMGECDVMMLVGSNPLLALATAGFENFNATKAMKAARARGMKLIVVDPRLTETARYADVHLRPRPASDAILFCGLLRLILEEGWNDEDFCRRYVNGLDDIRCALARFTPDVVENQTGVPTGDLMRAVALFARDSRKGFATTSTGVTMSPNSNLIDHLVQCLNVVCGRYRRAGDLIVNPGVLGPRRTRRARVIPPHRDWETGHRGRTGFGVFRRNAGAGPAAMFEMMTSTLPDEILASGGIRALVVQAGNPALSFPDQRKTLAALRKLDLLVVVDPYMTATAQLAHYILPTKLMYERTDLLMGPSYEFMMPEPFAQHLPAVARPPKNSELVDDWYIYWSLAKRLGLMLKYAGVTLDLDGPPPTTDDLLDIITRAAQVPLSVVRKHPGGLRVFSEPQTVGEAEPGDAGRFEMAPTDVLSDIERLDLRKSAQHSDYPFRLIGRRLREVYNSFGQQFSEIRRRMPHNPAYIHPADLAALGCADGDAVQITSANGRIVAYLKADGTLLPGTVAMAHSWGDISDDQAEAGKNGACTNALISIDRHREDINAMAWMSAIPVRVNPLAASSHAVRRT